MALLCQHGQEPAAGRSGVQATPALCPARPPSTQVAFAFPPFVITVSAGTHPMRKSISYTGPNKERGLLPPDMF